MSSPTDGCKSAALGETSTGTSQCNSCALLGMMTAMHGGGGILVTSLTDIVMQEHVEMTTINVS